MSNRSNFFVKNKQTSSSNNIVCYKLYSRTNTHYLDLSCFRHVENSHRQQEHTKWQKSATILYKTGLLHWFRRMYLIFTTLFYDNTVSIVHKPIIYKYVLIDICGYNSFSSISLEPTPYEKKHFITYSVTFDSNGLDPYSIILTRA